MTAEFTEQGGISWKNCVSVYSDGAGAETVGAKGFICRGQSPTVLHSQGRSGCKDTSKNTVQGDPLILREEMDKSKYKLKEALNF